ncbi:HVO_2523 family zinc finger protein [Haloprofundus halobius]|uniref:HVO_2523 family zinc finger protein n=1 Tax=Haloprofundus halobius TaxID=2876194 RepID=UPI001CCB139A|nr:HVO_2523 family zinc finger protein [Haloprofundus halobius]
MTESREGPSEAEADAEQTPRGRPCPLCDAPMQHRHCKYVCPSHGVVYDCSDTFW